MPGSFDQHFERGEEALSKFENAAALVAFEAALAVATAPDERALALNGLAQVYSRKDEKARALDLLDQAIAACLAKPDGEVPADGRIAHALAETLFEKGDLLMTLSRYEDALEPLEESLRRFLESVSVAITPTEEVRRLRRVIVRTLYMKGEALQALERLREATDCCGDLIRRFDRIDDNYVLLRVARAMRRCAWLARDFGRQDKEIAGCDEIFARFSANLDPGISEIVLNALEHKMKIYRDQDDFETVIEICDQIIGRYGGDPHWRIADSVARTMVRRAVAFGKRGNPSKELAAYDDVVRLYGESSEPMLRVHGAKALMFKAVTLNDADQSGAEIECYDEVIRRYAEDADEEVRVVAADALIHKGLSLGAIAEDAAEDTGEREVDAEIACYDAVVASYGDEEFIGLRRAVAEALLHKAETLVEAGRRSEALACLDSIIAGYIAVEDDDLQEIVKEAQGLKAEI